MLSPISHSGPEGHSRSEGPMEVQAREYREYRDLNLEISNDILSGLEALHAAADTCCEFLNALFDVHDAGMGISNASGGVVLSNSGT